MFDFGPLRNPVFKIGVYTVHRGRLGGGDYRTHWVEGPTLDGRMAPIASCWNEGDAVRRAREMHERDEAEKSDVR